jgi:hypothetical protein
MDSAPDFASKMVGRVKGVAVKLGRNYVETAITSALK